MGNAVMCAFPHPTSRTPSEPVLKLVHSNGLIEEFHRPVMVGELSPDYPHHFLCSARSLLSALIAGPPSSPPPRSATMPEHALADNFEMQVGQIYLLLPRGFPLLPSTIAALLTKASAVGSKDSYKDIHVVPFSAYPIFDECSLFSQTAPVSQDFVKQLLAESRLLLPTSISGPCLISPPQKQAVPSSSSYTARSSDHNSWRPLLETIFEESPCALT